MYHTLSGLGRTVGSLPTMNDEPEEPHSACYICGQPLLPNQLIVESYAWAAHVECARKGVRP
jgi:hypothetical protein